MRNMIFTTLMLALATTASAQVVIEKMNAVTGVPFIQSLVDGKMINAKEAGAFAVVADNQLKNYSNSAPFLVGVQSDSTIQYCAKPGSKEEFTFKYNDSSTTGNLVHLKKEGDKLDCASAR